MRKGHTPFGYRIENGQAVVNDKEAGQVRQIYANYLSGESYIEAAKNAGISMVHSSVKRMLQNEHYLGDDFYPAIIERETFDAVEAERQKRLEGRDWNRGKKMAVRSRTVYRRFLMRPIMKTHEDPYEQAAYIYSLIESEG